MVPEDWSIDGGRVSLPEWLLELDTRLVQVLECFWRSVGPGDE